MKKKLSIILILEMSILILLNIFKLDIFNMGKLLQFPYIQVSDLLRFLSLSGSIGNIISWILYISISIIPLMLFYIIYKKKQIADEDYLLILIFILLFINIYIGINPIVVGINQLIDLGMFFFILINQIIFLYIVLKFLKVEASSKNNVKLIIIVLFAINLISIFNIFGIKLNSIIDKVGENIIYYDISDIGQYDYKIIEKILIFINSNLLDLVYIFLSMNIIFILIDMKSKVDEENLISKLYILKGRIKKYLILSIMVTLIINIIFVLFSNYFNHIELKVVINMDLLIFMIIISYMVNYLIKVKEIKKENEMFI